MQIFGQHAAEGAESRQGAIVNFEVLDPEGKEFSYRYVERARRRRVFIYARVRIAAPVLQCVSHQNLWFSDVHAAPAHVCIGYKLQVLICRGFQ